MPPPKLLIFAGSAKATSLNKRIATIAANGAREAGAEVTEIDLKDYPMPILDEDLEAQSGPPENAARLQELFAANDGILLACPEYNGSITPLLKNAIDWVSRPGPDGSGLHYYRHKTAGLIAASPGGLGGLRGLVHVRSILSGLGMMVIPDQLAVPHAHTLFGENGNILDPGQEEKIKAIGKTLTNITARLSG